MSKSEERFQLAIRGTDAGIWDWDLRTNEVYFSPRWKSILGYTESEVRHEFDQWEIEKEAQLLAAAEIQSCLLPHAPPVIPGFEVAGRCYPADLAAGDHFDFHGPRDGSLVVVLADVSGHGVGPAILTACFHSRFLALAEATSDLPKIAGVLNSRLYQETAGELFITMIAGRMIWAHREQTAAEIIEALYQAVRAYLGTEKPNDDITVVLVRVGSG